MNRVHSAWLKCFLLRSKIHNYFLPGQRSLGIELEHVGLFRQGGLAPSFQNLDDNIIQIFWELS